MIDRAFDVDVENMESNPMNLRTAEREGSSGVEEKVVEISHNIDSSTGNVLKSKKQRRLSSRELMRENTSTEGVHRGSKHKRHMTADGKTFYEDLNNPGVTTWVLPENGVVVEDDVDNGGGGGFGGRKKRKGQQKKKGEKKDKQRLGQQTRHRRIDTADGLSYFEDVDNPGQTSWMLPENGVVV